MCDYAATLKRAKRVCLSGLDEFYIHLRIVGVSQIPTIGGNRSRSDGSLVRMRRELPFLDFLLRFGRLPHTMYGGNEHVTTAVDGFDVPRALRIVIECRPDFLDAAVHALLEVDVRFSPPKFLANLLPRHERVGGGGKQGEEFERLRSHSQERSRFSRPAPLKVSYATP